MSEVLLDVLVTDRKGNPILGLEPADFQVTEDDRKVQVTSAAFYSNRRYAGSEAAPAAANAPADNSGLAPHYFIFLFDDQRRNSADVPGLLQRQVRAGKDAIEWLRGGLAPTDWVAVLGYDNRLKLFQDFSQDREALERAIQSATTGRSGRENFPSRQALSAPGAPALAPGLPVGEAFSEQTRTIYEALTLRRRGVGAARRAEEPPALHHRLRPDEPLPPVRTRSALLRADVGVAERCQRRGLQLRPDRHRRRHIRSRTP